MTLEIGIRNAQRARRIDCDHLERVVRSLLERHVGVIDGALGVHLINARQMADLNWRWLRHAGSTDILTFDLIERDPVHVVPPEVRGVGMPATGGRRRPPPPSRQPRPPGPEAIAGAQLQGELYISVDDAVAQASAFGTTVAQELVRYVVHGVLHLLGCDDREASDRREMKRVENRLVRRLGREFDLRRLVRPPKPIRRRSIPGLADPSPTTAPRARTLARTTRANPKCKSAPRESSCASAS